MKDQKALLRNQQASILNIEKQLGQLVRKVNERRPGGLPSNTESNPKGAHINIVTTRSGKIITPLASIQNEDPKPVQEKEAEGQNQDQTQLIPESTRRVHDMDSTSSTPDQKNKPPVKPHQPPLPYPTRARQEKNEHIKVLQINIPFIEPVAQLPKYAKFLRELLTNRRMMEEVKKVVLNENCSVAMLNKLPKKNGEPGSLTFPSQFENLATIYALADSGEIVNLMPYSFFKKLDLPEPRPIHMAIHLANKTITFPRGICEDLLVKVDKFVFPVDFIVLDMEADPQVPIILGRPFLNTASAIIDMRDSKLTLRVGDESVAFGVDQAMKHARSSDDTAFSIDMLEELLEDWKEEKPSKSTVSFEEGFDAERDLMELERLLEEAEYNDLIRNEGIVLGHKVSRMAIQVDRAKVHTIAKLPPPTNVKGVRSFLGHSGFYRHCIKDFSKITRPLTQLLLKDAPFNFSKECLEAFNLLKKKLTTSPIMVAPNWSLPFKLMCDASDFAVGGVLGQRIEKHFQPIYYASKTLNLTQENYTTIEKELLAVVYAFDKFRSYLVLSKTIIFTDHSSLKYLFAKQDANPRLIRWVLLLQEFDIEIHDKKGMENVVADHLSRLENPVLEKLEEDKIGDDFSDAYVLVVAGQVPWFADIANYLTTK
ncbi:hypothetical protein Lser_V15G28541 [Lactuca serriola]